jgi:hypothetical protein
MICGRRAFETACLTVEKVSRGETAAHIGTAVVRGPPDGCLRGVTPAGASVTAGTKALEIDPRGEWTKPWKASGSRTDCTPSARTGCVIARQDDNAV